MTKNPAYWGESISRRPDVGSLLTVMLKHKGIYSKKEIPRIKTFLTEILQDAENMRFVGKNELEQWLAGSTPTVLKLSNSTETKIIPFISDIEKNIVTNQLDNTDGILDEMTKNKILMNATVNLTLRVNFILQHNMKIKENQQIENFLKMMLLPLKYDFANAVFEVFVTKKSIHEFLKTVKSKHTKFLEHKRKGIKEVETFLIQLALQEAKKEKSHDLKVHAFIKHLDVLQLNEESNRFIKEILKEPLNIKFIEEKITISLAGKSKPTVDLGLGLSEIITNNGKNEDIEEADHTNETGSQDLNKMKILDTLGLKEYYPNKLTLFHVRKKITTIVTEMKDVPWYLLNKILTIDYRGRNDLPFPNASNYDKVDKEENNKDNEDEDEEDSENDNYLADILNQLEEPKQMLDEATISPTDIVVAIYLCSTNFLKQLLSQKMMMCKLSIPLLVPDVTGKLISQNWSFRDIVLNSNGKEITALMQKVPIVSFVRVGNDLPLSKSKLMNNILNKQSHNTFFNKGCRNGSAKRILSQGLVDAAWYIPSESDKEYCECPVKDKCKCQSKELTMFLNLHGDSTNYDGSLNAVCQLSNVLVVVIDLSEDASVERIKESLKSIVPKSKNAVIIVSKRESAKASDLKKYIAALVGQLKDGSVCLKKVKWLFAYSGETAKDDITLRNETIKKILESLKDCEVKAFTNLLENLDQSKVISDESKSECQRSKSFAREIIDNIDTSNEGFRAAKKKHLPLQGDLWIQWGNLKKKEKRPKLDGNITLDRYNADLYQKRKDLRKEQLVVCSNLSKVITLFVKNLLRLQGDAKFYFVHWLRLYLDNFSRNFLPEITSNYSKLWLELQEIERKYLRDPNNIDKKRNDRAKEITSELGVLEKTLQDSSFGWEHLIREIGQIYEAVTELNYTVSDTVLKDVTNSIEKLPKAMAELLLQGYPMEVMDGNAAHVPLQWVQAVFKKVQELIGDKKLFVLSVLGVQSSGKSTLLNAMFGLQFAVKAGRCTKGVFAQLVPVPKTDQEHGYDYIMIVDTEGLRAPELGNDKNERDNELATLAIGIGDLCIINIKGENQAVMQEVLQIVVHAFLRMQIVNRNLKLTSSCFFIHQNVGAQNAGKQMQVGSKQLLEKLNKMTKSAADTEGVFNIISFSQIIEFNVETNVRHFSNLWEGEPPMAPVNPGYSRKVNEVKSTIIEEVLPKKHFKQTISMLSSRIGDLWDGILADDFVFSFKNSLEIQAKRALEIFMNDLAWSLTDFELKWFNDNALNKIKSIVGNSSELETQKFSLNHAFKNSLEAEYEKSKEKLSKFFNTSKDAAMFEQWKESSRSKIRILADEIRDRTYRAIGVEFKVREIQIKEGKQNKAWEKEMSSKTTELAKSLQGKEMTEDELQMQFNVIWSDMLKNQPKRESINIAINVTAAVESVLSDSLKAERILLQNELKKNRIDDKVEDLAPSAFEFTDEHFKIATYVGFIKKIDQRECKDISKKELKRLFDSVEKYVKEIKLQSFKKAQADKMASMINDFVNRQNEKSKSNKFEYTNTFRAAIMVYIFRYAKAKFQKMHEDYIEKVNPSSREKLFREQLFIKFKHIYNRSATEKVAADLVSKYLEALIKDKIQQDIPRVLANFFRDDNNFVHSKRNLQAKVLIDLLEEPFEEYKLFISNASTSLRKWLKKYLCEYLFEVKTKNYERIAKAKLAQLVLDVIRNLSDILIPKKLDRILENWIKSFVEMFSELLGTKAEGLEEVKNIQVDGQFNFENFNSILTDNLKIVQAAMTNEYKLATSLPGDQCEGVIDILADHTLGCKEQCPWCGALCSITSKKHVKKEKNLHSALQHRPQGVGGLRWVSDSTLVTMNCTTAVASTTGFLYKGTSIPCKEYKKVYPKWEIPADASLDASLYWKRFMAQNVTELASWYDARVPDIDQVWRNITKEEAKENLKKDV